MKKPWYVYIAEFGNGALYTGISTDVKRRIKQHNEGKGAKSLRGKGPVKLVYEEIHGTVTSARIREAAIKKWTRLYKLKLILSQKKGLP